VFTLPFSPLPYHPFTQGNRGRRYPPMAALPPLGASPLFRSVFEEVEYHLLPYHLPFRFFKPTRRQGNLSFILTRADLGGSVFPISSVVVTFSHSLSLFIEILAQSDRGSSILPPFFFRVLGKTSEQQESSTNFSRIHPPFPLILLVLIF